MEWVNTVREALKLAESKGLAYCNSAGAKTDVRRLATDLGVDRLELRPMEEHALSIKRRDGHFTVFLNSSQHRLRHRFSLAHEIAHILLTPIFGQQTYHRSTFSPDQDPLGKRREKLCDQMAALILMPTQRLFATVDDFPQSAACVPGIAKQFDVSFEAAARRFLKLTPIPCAMLVWRPDPHGRFLPLQSATCNAGISMHSVALATPPGRLLQASRALRASEMVVSSEFVELVYRRGRSSSVGHLPDAKVESLGFGTGLYRRIFSFVYMPTKTGTLDQTS